MSVNHVQENKKIRLNQPQQFLSQERVVVETAYPGDIIGIHDPGIFKIGDSLCENNTQVQYHGIPLFAPEHFCKVFTKNALKRKQFIKGINQLSEEGTIQVYKQPNIGVEELIIGVVGALQFEVLEYRLKNEYGVDIIMENLPYQYIRWINGEDFNPEKLSLTMDSLLVEDQDLNPVVLFINEWSISRVAERNENVSLKEISFRNKIIAK
jgi:peptide chain release factor 3